VENTKNTQNCRIGKAHRVLVIDSPTSNTKAVLAEAVAALEEQRNEVKVLTLDKATRLIPKRSLVTQ
jgi:hypothetical protein